MKKILFLAIMAMMTVCANAQYKRYDSNAVAQSKSKVTNPLMKQQQPLQTAGWFNGGEIVGSRMDRKFNLDASKLQPVKAKEPKFETQLPKGKLFTKAQGRRMVNVKPTVTMQPTATQSATARKAPEFASTYFATGDDYRLKQGVEWTMTPSTGIIKDEQTGEKREVSVLVDIIPTPDYFSDIFPDGIPVLYTIEDNVITINPQAVLSYQNEAMDTTFYVTVFSPTSEDEDGVINMELDEDGKLAITNGNWICFGEFANVEFDPDMGDGEAYLGWDELYANVAYYYNYGLTIEQEYNAYGIDAETNDMVTWTMQRATFKRDDETILQFINMCPLLEEFMGIYPNGIDVEYEQSGNIITVKPQLIASYTAQDGTNVFLLLHSGTSDNGNIVLTLGEDGTPNTIQGEEVTIGAWSKSEFDASFDTYLGYYASTRRVKYQLPGAAPLAPEDVACEPGNAILFAGQSLSGYYYGNYNLAMTGAYAPTTFKNITEDPASGYEWTVKENGEEERTITGNTRDFTINTIGGYGYEGLTLKAENQGSWSETYKWGCTGINSESGELLCDTAYVYAGAGQSYFGFTDGTYATMTPKSSDDEMLFYTNWATPDKNSTSMSRIYSYMGKPSTPLFINGVMLPLIAFTSEEDFNLHLIIYKCTRNQNGSVTLGDIIAEADATSENINADYSDRNIWGIEFTDLYVEDEMGMSESLDYLFIEDEFLVCFDGWDNGTFSGVPGSDDNVTGRSVTTWFEETGDETHHLYRYTQWKPQLFVGLIGATYGYLHTTDNTNLSFGAQGGKASIHVEPMYFGWDEEDETLPVPSIYLESITVDGEEMEEMPEWVTVDIDNFDQTVDADGYPNNIDYDLVFTASPLEAGVEGRTAELVYMQRGARLKVTITQGEGGESVIGDVNGDGTVDVADISAIISQMAGLTQYTAADVNGDGSVDVADISKVISIMAGL